MNHLQILDCTLRDGAQVNKAKFGEKAIKEIVENLTHAGLDIIECGFLKNCEYECGRTYYPQPSFARPYIPEKTGNIIYAALMDYGRYDVEHLEPYSGESFDLIRISFFEKDLGGLKPFIQKVIDKGYKVSIQPMDTFSYSEQNIKKVIEIANSLQAEALSMVDTYSLATIDDIDRVYNFYENYLNKNTKIGFHSHNNLDLAFITAQDILDMIDTYLVDFKNKFECGYSLPMMYAGIYGVHVFTTAYLKDKPNVTSYDLKCMFEMLDNNKKKRYDYDYLDSIYEQYMKNKTKR